MKRLCLFILFQRKSIHVQYKWPHLWSIYHSGAPDTRNNIDFLFLEKKKFTTAKTLNSRLLLERLFTSNFSHWWKGKTKMWSSLNNKMTTNSTFFVSYWAILYLLRFSAVPDVYVSPILFLLVCILSAYNVLLFECMSHCAEEDT